MRILHNNILYLNRCLILETVPIRKVSEGLSKFYEKNIEVNKNNLDDLAGDIQALFFDFKQSFFLAVCSDGATYTDSSNNMGEFVFHLEQKGIKNIKRVKQL